MVAGYQSLNIRRHLGKPEAEASGGHRGGAVPGNRCGGYRPTALSPRPLATPLRDPRYEVLDSSPGGSPGRGSPTASSLEEWATHFPLPPLPLANGGDGEGINSTKLAAGLRSVARNYKATRLLTRPG